MPTLTVNLAKTYSLSLKESTATHVDWEGVAGQNKLRRFFAHPEWESYIAQVSVSSAGVKGGVFFLEAYEVEPTAFMQQLKALNSPAFNNASAVWRRLHRDNHLAGGIIGYNQALAPDTQGWQRPERRIPAVVKTQVMQHGFTLPADAIFGQDAAARSTLLTALRNAAELQRRYVVKGTSEPGRVLFAEYVLNTIGKAKIPKSLVLEIDPSRPHTDADPSEGMIMLNLINTQRNPAADAARYNASYANLRNGAQSVVDYLVVQKLMAGDMLTEPQQLTGKVVEFLCQQKIIVDTFSFSTNANFAGESEGTLNDLVQELHNKGILTSHLVAPNYQAPLPTLDTLNNKKSQIQAVLAANLPTFASNGLDPQNYYKSPAGQLDQLVNDLKAPGAPNSPLAQALTQLLDTLRPIIARNERVLSDVAMMKNTASVHFADALLGNGDRFHNFNTGNMFYVTRQAAPGSNKASNPVGCIDNDSFLHTCMPRQGNEGFANVADYVSYVLRPQAELWGWASAEPQGMVPAPNMGVAAVLNYDTWFTYFFSKFITDALPTAVLKLYSAHFFARDDTVSFADTDPFTTTQALQGWAQVRRSLREGVVEALSNYLSIDKRDQQLVYAALAERYFPGPNFEYTALEIRNRYLRECRVDPQALTITQPTAVLLKNFKTAIADWLITSGALNPECDTPQVSPIAERALVAGVELGHILAADADSIRQLLSTMAVSDQDRLLPNPFASGPIFTIIGKPRIDLEKKWAGLKSKYRKRMAVVICTLLQRFRNQYIAEVGYLTHDRRRVLQSKAFKAAQTLGEQVSDLRLFKDERTTFANRQQVLRDDLNLTNYVTASS